MAESPQRGSDILGAAHTSLQEMFSGLMIRKRWLTTILAVLACTGEASAQDTTAGMVVEVGAGVSAFGLFREDGRPKTSPGVGGWLTVGSTTGVALEGRVNWFPTTEFTDFESQGGRTLAVMGGFTGTLLAAHPIAITGLLQPGFVRFADAATGHPDGRMTVGARTHFALNLGFGFEFRPTALLVPRIDFLHTMYVVPGATLAPSHVGNGVTVRSTRLARVVDTYQVSVGAKYRVRGTAAKSLARRRPQALSLGPLLTYSAGANSAGLVASHSTGIGVYLSYPIVEFVSADASITTFLEKLTPRTPWDGGRITQALAGAKIGVRRERVGAFLKVRAGVNSHSEAFQGRDSAAGTIYLGRSNVPVIDLGGIVEVDAGARMLIRMEAGSLISLYGPRTVLVDGTQLPQGGQRSKQSIQMSLATGWRF